MRTDDVTKLNWKQDKGLLAAESRMANLVEREAATRTGLATLQEIIREDEKLLVKARAAVLLDEESDQSEDVVQHRLTANRQEVCHLISSLEAFEIARLKLEPLVQVAGSEARKRVAEKLVVHYQETAEELGAILERAADLNRFLHAVHQHVSKQNLKAEIFGSPHLKPLSFSAAWGFLSQPSGLDSLEFGYWKSYTAKIFGRN